MQGSSCGEEDEQPATSNDFLADAAATNSNFRRNNCTYQNIFCPPYLYQKLSKKATQLHLLGMSYQQISQKLKYQ